MFGNGWHKFAKDVEREGGDSLVLFKHKTKLDNLLNVCIFKGEDYVNDFG